MGAAGLEVSVLSGRKWVASAPGRLLPWVRHLVQQSARGCSLTPSRAGRPERAALGPASLATRNVTLLLHIQPWLSLQGDTLTGAKALRATGLGCASGLGH